MHEVFLASSDKLILRIIALNAFLLNSSEMD